MRVLPALVMVLVSTACGFQLRGNISLPPEMSATYVSYSGGDSEILRIVVRALNLADVRIVNNVTDASAILKLPVSAVRRRVLLKDTQGRAREYEIVVTLQYQVVTPEGAVLVPLGSVVRRTNVELDPVNPLAGAGDVERAVEALREEAVWQMLEQLNAPNNIVEPVE